MSAALLTISGWSLLLSTLVTILHGFIPQVPIALAGFLSACAAILLIQKLGKVQRIQVLLLSIIGFVLILTTGEDLIVKLVKALTANGALIALLVSVGFLKLIIKAGGENEALPKGNLSLWKTLFGLHFFTAVISLSAIMLFGDRLKHKGTLQKEQFMVLSRNFNSATYWSPFFAAMGAALLYSGGANVGVLIPIGICVSICALVITGIQCTHILKREKREFEGYPMHFKSLYLPLILSIQVLIGHKLFPHVSTLILVAVIVLLTVMIKLLFTYSPVKSASIIKAHVETGITHAASELLLFLSAGILAVGINALIASMNYSLPLESFGGIHASMTMCLTVMLALIGLHPVISITVLGSILAPIAPDQNLLGLMFLFSWGVGVIANPLSGISLLLQSRYNISGYNLIRLNASYILLTLALCSAVLILYDKTH